MKYMDLLKQEQKRVVSADTKEIVGNIKKFASKESFQNTRCSVVHDIFCAWCAENNLQKPNAKHFGYALGIAYGVKSKIQRINCKNVRIYF